MTLFGGIDRTTKVAFAVSVHKRDAATLIALFSKKHEDLGNAVGDFLLKK